MNNFKKVLFFVCLFQLVAAEEAFSADQGIPSPYANIQAAVNAASDGDSIVFSNTTALVSDFNPATPIDKGLTFKSANPATPAIVRPYSGTAAAPVSRRFVFIPGTGSATSAFQDIILQNTLALTTLATSKGGAIENNGQTLTFTNTTLNGNRALDFGGAVYNGSGTLNVNAGTSFTANQATGTAAGSGRGGAIYNQGTVNITGAAFGNTGIGTGNTAVNFGGAIYNDGGILNINAGTSFLRNAVTSTAVGTGYGGAIYNTGATSVLNITGAAFGSSVAGTGNGASNSGGAIYNDGGTISVNAGTSFTNNTANATTTAAAGTGYGGAIYNTGSALTIAGTSFDGNKAGNLGGAIYHESTEKLTINAGTSFTNNITTNTSTTGTLVGGGGAIYSKGADIDVLGTSGSHITFLNNRATGRSVADKISGSGGAILNDGGSAVTVEYTDFITNAAVNYGGAIYNGGGNLSLDNVSFQGNTLTGGVGHGGAIYNDGGTLDMVGAVSFSNNAANATTTAAAGTGYGGAIYNTGSALTVNGATFDGNKAGNLGGAIYHESTEKLTINAGTSFTNNVTTNTSTTGTLVGGGGAIYSKGADIDVLGTSGSRIIFSGNKATGRSVADKISGSGGAILNDGGSAVTVEYTDFVTNISVNSGGAIYNDGGTLDLNNTSFQGNTVTSTAADTGFGGAVYNKDAALTVVDTIFDANKAGGAGGAIYHEGVEGLTISGNTSFTNNSATGGTMGAGGAIYLTGEATNTITGTSSVRINFTGNTAKGANVTNEVVGSGGAISNTSGSTLTVDYADFTGNQSGFGGAVYNNATITVNNSKFDSNSISGGAGRALGGAFVNGVDLDKEVSGACTGDQCGRGIAYINDSEFTNNSAANFAGAIANRGYMEITNTTFSNNASTGQWGGAILNGGIYKAGEYDGSHAGEMIVTDSTFVGNYAGGGGGGAIANGDAGIIDIIRTVFDGNSAKTEGGAFYNETQATITDGEFKNNFVTNGSGGAIFSSSTHAIMANPNDPVHLTVTGTQFTKNIASGTGGGVYLAIGGPSPAPSPTADLYPTENITNISGATFTENSAGQRGGAIYGAVTSEAAAFVIDRKLTTTIDDTTFTKNAAGLEGGALYFSAAYQSAGKTSFSKVTVTNSTFDQNKVVAANADVKGGALYNTSSVVGVESSVALTDSTFTGNNVTTTRTGGTTSLAQTATGGAIYNTATNNADAIINLSGSATEFLNNSATASVTNTVGTATANSYGGAIYNTGTGAVVNIGSDIQFSSNATTANATAGGNATASAQGGVIYNTGSGATVDIGSGVQFLSNTVTANATGSGNATGNVSGGVIYNLNGGKITVADGVSFTGNKAVIGTVTAGSTATENAQGGAIYNSGSNSQIDLNGTLGDRIVFSGNEVRGNSTLSGGGAIYNNTNSIMSVAQTEFKDNISDMHGGAIYNAGITTINGGTTFSGNTADGDGGAIYHNSGTALVLDSTAGDITFTGNIASSAARGNDIYSNNRVINITGSANKVYIGSGIAGTGTINKSGVGQLVLDSDNSNFTGVFNSTGGITIVTKDGKFFNGTRVNQKIQTSTLQVSSNAFDYKATFLNDSSLRHLLVTNDGTPFDVFTHFNAALTTPAAATSNLALGSATKTVSLTFGADDSLWNPTDPAQAQLADYVISDTLKNKLTGTAAAANYNQISDVGFEHAHVTFGLDTYAADALLYKFNASNIDIADDGHRVVDFAAPVDVTDTTISFAIDLSGASATADQFKVASSTGTLDFGTITILAGTDHGLLDNSTANVLTNINFTSGISKELDTEIYHYVVTPYNSTGITLDAVAASSNNSLNNANKLTGTRAFNMSFFDPTLFATPGVYEYTIGQSLDVAGTGSFLVQGYDVGGDASKTVLSGSAADSFFRLTGATNLTVNDLTIEDAYVAGNGSVLNIGSAGTAVLNNVVIENNASGGLGGAVYNAGTLTLSGETVFANNTDSSGANDIYNTGTINMTNGLGTTVSIGGGIAGTSAGVINKSGAGDLLIDGDSSGYAGSFNSTGGVTTVSDVGKMFGGGASKNNVSNSTLSVTGEGVYYGVTLGNNGILNHYNTVDTQTIVGGGSNIKLAAGATGAQITFDKDPSLSTNATYHLADKIDNGLANAVTFNNADVTLGSTNYTGGTTYNFNDSNLDLTTSGNSVRSINFGKINVTDTTLSFDISTTLSGSTLTVTSDHLVAAAGSTGEFDIGTIKVLNDQDNGLQDELLVTDVLSGGLTFDDSFTGTIATTAYEYDMAVDSDKTGLVLTVVKEADENSLYRMNALAGDSGFNFSYYANQPTVYNIGQSLRNPTTVNPTGKTGSGNFAVTGFDTDATHSVISGIIVNSMGVPTGGRGAFFDLSNVTHLTVSNLTIEDAYTSGNGSVLVMTNNSASAVFNNVILQNNDADGNGGAIAKSGTGSLVIGNSVLSGNVALLDGGAIYNTGTNVVIGNTVFDANAATNGGAIYNTGTMGILGGTSFTDNAAGTNGGAIYNSGTLTLNSTAGNIEFDGNMAAGVDNDIYNAGGTINFTGIGNQVVIGGGIAGTGTINKTGTEQLLLNGDSSAYTGTFNQTLGQTISTNGYFAGLSNIIGGTVELAQDSSISSTTQFAIGTNGILKISTGDDLTLNAGQVNAYSGTSGTINKTGAGTLNVAGDNSGFKGAYNQSGGDSVFTASTFGGVHNITNGTAMELADGSSIASTAVLSLASGTSLDITSDDSLTVGANQIRGNGGTFGEVNKTGTGTLNVTGSNAAFTGDFNQTDGLTVFTAATFGGTHNITGGTMELAGASNIATGAVISLGSGGVLDISKSTAMALDAAQLTDNAGTYGTVNKTGSGVLVLTGDHSTFTGAFNATDGTTVVGLADKLFGGTNTVSDGAVLQVTAASIYYTVDLDDDGVLNHLSTVTDPLTPVVLDGTSGIAFTGTGATATFGRAAGVTDNAVYTLAAGLGNGNANTVNFVRSTVDLGVDNYADDVTYNFTQGSLLTIDNGSNRAVEFSNLGVANSSIDLRSAVSGVYNTLTAQNYVGNNANVYLNVPLGDDTSVGDQIIIQGDGTPGSATATGSTTLYVTDVAIQPNAGRQTNLGIKVVDAQSGATIDAGAFSLAGGVLDATTAYEYRLFQGDVDVGGTDDQSYFLRSTAKPTNTANTVWNVPAIHLSIIKTGMNSLRKRMGELRDGDWAAQNSLWARTYAKSLNVNDTIDTRMNLYGVEAGLDAQVGCDSCDNPLYVGMMVGYEYTDNIKTAQDNAFQGSGYANTPSVGAYATWMNGAGWYVDATTRYFWSNLEMSTFTSIGTPLKFKPDRQFITASLEAGKQFEWCVDCESKFVVEPKAEVQYAYSPAKGFGVGDIDNRLDYGKTQSVMPRAGVKVGYSREMDNGIVLQPFAEAMVGYELDGKTKVTYADADYQSDLSGAIYEFTAGLNARLRRNISTYMDVTVETGAVYQSIAGNVGVRVSF